MNLEEVDKWLDNEYGCSYTRLEELHDFVIEQDMKHQEEKNKEIEKLNNIIKEIREYIKKASYLQGNKVLEEKELLEILDKEGE